MIKKLHIKGFQSWKNLSVDLSPGINVFVGESDQGKSAIIRALRWLLFNRPTGDAFRNFDLKKKELVSVGAEFAPGGWVTRRKNSTVNEYVLGQGAEVVVLKALRSDIPAEVQELTRIPGTNIQAQHEQYFLLDQSPGQVAKEFNKVAGR